MSSNKNKLWSFKKIICRMEVQVLLAMGLGILVASTFPNADIIADNFSWMGILFMKLLKIFLAPLLFFSVLVAVMGLGDIKKLGTIGLRTMLYYMLTTTLAIVVSLFVMNIFQPGKGIVFAELSSFNSAGVEALTFSNFILSLVSDNFLKSFVDMNAMQIVVTSMILGIFILVGSEKSKVDQFKDIVDTINKGILSFIGFVVKLTPFGVFSIIMNIVVQNGVESIKNLLPFVFVILLSLGIHAFITLPLIGFTLGKFNPFLYFTRVKDAVILGFSTSSSSATMGLSMKVARENAKLSKEVVDFTFPLGTTVNMDGTALYQAGVAIFVSQVVGVDLSISTQLTIIGTVILASIGAAGIPGAGILILTTVFLSIGLPIEAIGIILAVDRMLDMFRTGVNVWGDLLTAKVIDRFYKMEVLEKSERKELFKKSELKANVVVNS